MQKRPGRSPAHDRLWFVLDPEELLQGVFRTKSEALRHALGSPDGNYAPSTHQDGGG